ncbi:MAG: hypothetical protein INR73_03445 [Williamsia sp.]|nr:hypothetical protein [Williamsia sp.]
MTTILLHLYQLAFATGPVTDTLGTENLINTNRVQFTVEAAMKSRTALKGILGFSKQSQPVEAYYFPGTSSLRALVIGGVHGTELSSIDVATELVAQLQQQTGIYYSVIVIPSLFPDNAQMARNMPVQIGSSLNIGRYSHSTAPDPNRQMPSLGKPFDEEHPVDYLNREIEQENRLLLTVIQQFKPERIVNIHAIRNEENAGIFADPRTDADGYALEYASDSILAVRMAQYIEAHDGCAPGNKLQQAPTTLYACDPAVAQPGARQPRNLHGSSLGNNRGTGVSLGSWATTAVADTTDSTKNRPAIRLLTMEFPGCKRPTDYAHPAEQLYRKKLVTLYAQSIAAVFLSDSGEGDQEDFRLAVKEQ